MRSHSARKNLVGPGSALARGALARGASAALLSLFVGLCVAASGCKRDKPHVPYTIGDSAATLESAKVPAPATSEPPRHVNGRPLVMPAGVRVDKTLSKDVDGDGVADDVLLLSHDGETDRRDLAYRLAGRDAVNTVGSVRLPLPNPTCSLKTSVDSAGKRSVSISVEPDCADHVRSVKTSVVALASFAREAPRFSTLRLEEAPGQHPFVAHGEGTDVDGDGVDDVVWTFHSTDEKNSPALVVRLIDRPSGLGRDTDEPEASLRKWVAELKPKAARAKDMNEVARSVARARALYFAVCDDGGKARVTLDGKRGFSCGKSDALDELDVLEVKALASFGDVARAVTALDRMLAGKVGRNAGRLKDAEGFVALAAPAKQVRVDSRTIAAKLGSAVTSLGPLAFDESGLLVRVGSEVKVLALPTLETASTAPPAWGETTLDAGDLSVLDVYDPCDGNLLHATASVGGRDPEDVVLPVEAHDRCGSRTPPVSVMPLGSVGGAVYLLVGAEPIKFDAQGATRGTLKGLSPLRGTPRSLTSDWTVNPTQRGLFVQSDKRAFFLQSKGFEGSYADLKACTVNGDASAVACVQKDRVVLFHTDAVGSSERKVPPADSKENPL